MHNQAKQIQQGAAQVHKFGGSSLASAKRFTAVADILLQQNLQQPLWVVVSAPGDTTDALLDIIRSKDDVAACQEALRSLYFQLVTLIEATLPSHIASLVAEQLQQWLAGVPNALAMQQFNDVLAIGERVSALLLSEVLRQRQCRAIALDARDFLRLHQHQPNLVASKQLLEPLTEADTIHVVTGYIARDDKGHSITLGRNGSDYSATLLAALVAAAEVTIWTDVKAIYSADPRKVSTAVPYQQVSWQQACQLAQLGNPVLHARTLSPLTGTDTALLVRSSYEPHQPGCRIVQQHSVQQSFITELNDVTLLTLRADAGFSAANLALQLQQPVIAVSLQAGSQYWLLPAACAEQALDYLSSLDVHAVWDTQRYHALAWIKHDETQQGASADQLLQQHGVLHRYETLHQVIWLLAEPVSATLQQQLHQQLIQPAPQLQLVVAGTGNVGAEFLSMLGAQQQRFASRLTLNLAGVLNSRQAALCQHIALTEWPSALTDVTSWQPEQLIAYVAALPSPKVVVDITPSREFSLLYPAFVAAGCDIISANKQGVTLPNSDYQQIQQALEQHERYWLTNTTCGAGIPVQRTLQELLNSGDQIHEVSGIFSGTLSWLLCQFDGSKPFSDFVLEAQQAGLTEPDPRDDLSGKDVQRKLLVIARELGLTLELDDIDLQPLLPSELEHGSWQDFWSKRDALDAALAALFAEANAAGKVLRYVARLSLGSEKVSAQVALQQVSPTDALGAISPCDNVFAIRSLWYSENPLVLKGPGAGRVVTAGGLHADLAQLIQQRFKTVATAIKLT